MSHAADFRLNAEPNMQRHIQHSVNESFSKHYLALLHSMYLALKVTHTNNISAHYLLKISADFLYRFSLEPPVVVIHCNTAPLLCFLFAGLVHQVFSKIETVFGCFNSAVK